MKRSIGIILLLVAQILKASGIPVPDDIENIIQQLIEWLGAGVGLWGIVHAAVRTIIARKKAASAS